MNKYLFFFFFIGFTAQAQKDSVQLVDIQSSECGGMYHVKPGFISRKTMGDTTFMTLFCSNNCAGYHDPSVSLSGDSVLIKIGYGEKVTRFKLLNGEYIEEDEIDIHSKDSILEEVTEAIASCDCCYTFELKALGLDSSMTYNYYYNNQYIDPSYKTTGEVKEYHFPYFLEAPQYEVFEKLKKIVYKSKNKALLEELKSFHLRINITADTINSSIDHVEIKYLNKIKNTEVIDKKIMDYLMSVSAMILVRNQVKNRWVRKYIIYFGFNWEREDQMEMTFDAGERMSD